MIRTKFDVPCFWGGTLTGFIIKSQNLSTLPTKKFIGLHGWLDNLNSLLPLVEKLIDRHSNYEIYLYDAAGHGFSSHLPKGFHYEFSHHFQDLRHVIQTLGWINERFSIIGHSYGAMLGTAYAGLYPNEVICVVAIDALPRIEVPVNDFWQVHGNRVDASLQFHQQSSRNYETELTHQKAIDITKATRPGLTDAAAELLIERSTRRDSNGKLHLTRDEQLKILSLILFDEHLVHSLMKQVQIPLLLIAALNPQWPRPEETIEFLRQYNPRFEMTLIDGPHHLHMTHVNEVFDQMEKFFEKYLFSSAIEKSKL